MAVVLDEKLKFITDRTIPEILKFNRNIRKKDLLKFCIMLGKLGVDFIEINRDAFEKIEVLLRGMEFIYRIEDEKDIAICADNHFKHCVVNCKQFLYSQFELVQRLKAANITIEINLNDISRGYKLTRLRSFIDFSNIYCLRIYGLNKFILPEGISMAKKIKESLNVKVDVCPENKYFMATAIAVEGIRHDADSITTAFAGYGGRYGFAALEEVLLALQIIDSLKIDGDTGLFPQVCKLYRGLTGIDIPKMKPILGEDIFKYESGIHADGIEKNPCNYEPYEPDKVGQKRRLVLGKHSGTRAVVSKLRELGVNHENIDISRVLGKIREKSIELKREIFDHELIQICEDNSFGRLKKAI
ncbi:MAG: nifVo [Clostridia bacterium]|jgi:homocitrate synthase NifV|nr:nifVo [Clostridia bacterium]